MAYQLKTIIYKDTTRRILLQNINGPCPLLAAANALLLKGVISLSGECVRSGVASTDDVVNMLAGWAIERASTNTSSDNEYHLNEVLSLLPSLQHGMDVNPKFDSPTGVEYTNNLAAFDSLGIELVHGWLVDPVEAAAVLIQDKSYNELIELVIGGSEAKDEIERLSDFLAKLEEMMVVTEVKQSEICVSPGAQEEADAQPNEIVQLSIPESKSNIPATDQSEGSNENSDCVDSSPKDENNDPCSPEQKSINTASCTEAVKNNTPVFHKELSVNAIENTVDELPSSEQESSTGKDQFINKASCKDAKETNTPVINNEESPKYNATTDLSTREGKAQNLTSIQRDMAEVRQKISAQSEIIFKAQTINDFLSESSHQLTYHGLERLQKYLSEDGLSVFFRNNHFATITKHDSTLYLLVRRVVEIEYAMTLTCAGDSSFIRNVTAVF